MITRSMTPLAIAALLALVGGACRGGKEEAPSSAGQSAAANPAASGAGAPGAPGGATQATPTAGHKAIVVEMITDETGNYFKPKEIEAHQGDVIRFTLKQGVHNVDFLPDSNTIKAGLPPVAPLLQLPGQTWDVVTATMQPGKYYFQCDPHAALGMKGKLEIEKD